MDAQRNALSLWNFNNVLPGARRKRPLRGFFFCRCSCVSMWKRKASDCACSSRARARNSRACSINILSLSRSDIRLHVYLVGNAIQVSESVTAAQSGCTADLALPRGEKRGATILPPATGRVGEKSSKEGKCVDPAFSMFAFRRGPAPSPVFCNTGQFHNARVVSGFTPADRLLTCFFHWKRTSVNPMATPSSGVIRLEFAYWR